MFLDQVWEDGETTLQNIKAFSPDQRLTCFCLRNLNLQIRLPAYFMVTVLNPHLCQIHRSLETAIPTLHRLLLLPHRALNFSMHEALIRDISLLNNSANQSGLTFFAVQVEVDRHQIHQVVMVVVTQVSQATEVFQTCMIVVTLDALDLPCRPISLEVSLVLEDPHKARIDFPKARIHFPKARIHFHKVQIKSHKARIPQELLKSGYLRQAGLPAVLEVQASDSGYGYYRDGVG